jgi:hypothetical protein
MNVIIYDQGPGLPAAIVRPAPGFSIEAARSAVPAGAVVIVVDESVVPADRTFRDAWKLDQSQLVVDMAKAREIHKDHLRQMRAPRLAEADAEFLRAIEIEDRQLQAEIAAKKQALRDVTADPAIAAARTPEELKAAVPAILKD